MESVTIQNEKGQSLTVNCSPRSAKNLTKDPELCAQLFAQSFATELEENSEESTQSFAAELEGASQESSQSFAGASQESKMEVDFDQFEENCNTKKAVWLEKHCKLLIAVYKEIRPKLGKHVDVKNKTKMWGSIAKKMNEKGYSFTACQVESKWKSLERAFKNKTSHNRKTGRDTANCSFEKELTDVMEKSASIFPPFTLGSYNEGRKSDQILGEIGITVEEESGEKELNESTTDSISALEESDPNNTGSSSNSKSSKRVSSVAKEIRFWREERCKEKAEENERKKRLEEEKAEFRKAKLKAYEERTKETKRKNDILEGLLKYISEKENSLK